MLSFLDVVAPVQHGSTSRFGQTGSLDVASALTACTVASALAFSFAASAVKFESTIAGGDGAVQSLGRREGGRKAK